jgi:4-amino-4-deoxy-L-arabinose transferase-like glycosyltransferase
MTSSVPARGSPKSIAVAPGRTGRRRSPLMTRAFIGLMIAAILLRLVLVLMADNKLNAPWGGVGDAPAYLLLSQNLAAGKGYAYAGHPTAYRAPLYPLALAAAIVLAGRHAIEAVRLVQFVLGLLVCYLCACLSGKLFGPDAKKTAFIIALFFPTLVVMTGEILTETSATLASAVFLYLLVRFLDAPSWPILAGLSAVVGFATLIHFNMALFGIVILSVVLFKQNRLPRFPAAALTIILPGLIVSPWLIRNFVVFNGALTLSTESGPAVVMGVLTPQGRALPGDSERLRGALGWIPPTDLETNGASRDSLGDEATLNRQAWSVTFHLWRRAGWSLVPLTIKKLFYFWLSTDQLFWTASFRPLVRVARAAGVLLYWVLLAFAIRGWFKLRILKPNFAYIFFFYAVLVTVLHIPFNMNTRLRMPFIDPLLASLAAAPCIAFGKHFRLAKSLTVPGDALQGNR